MLRKINIKADGRFEIDVDGTSVTGQIENDDLPPDVDAVLAAIRDRMIQSGISEVHAEQDTFRAFEHTVKGGHVRAARLYTFVTRPEFEAVISQKDALST